MKKQLEKISHKIATDWELIPYTLEDIVEKVQKTKKEVIITAVREKYQEEYPEIVYQPIARIGEKSMDIGKPICVNFDPPIESKDLRHEIIKSIQNEVEKICINYKNELCSHGVNARYQNFP